MAVNAKKTPNIEKLTVKGPLSERVYKELKKALLDGQFAPGDLLPEDFLTDATGASRTPVREALMRLQGDGLVKIIPRRGARVLELDAVELGELVEARGLLETSYLERAMEKIPRAKFEEIRHDMNLIINEMETLDTGSSEWAQKRLDYSKLDFEFHHLLVEAVGNRFLLKYYDEILEKVILYSHHTVIKYPEAFLQSAYEHDGILNALLNHDGSQAKRLIIHHFEKLNNRMKSSRIG
jgi:DNA-binding GntR family transcriptional regulator